MAGLGLFVFGAFGLYVLSTWLTVLQLRLSRRTVVLHTVQLLAVAAGTGLLAWLDHASRLSAIQAWAAVAAAVASSIVVNLVARRR